MLKRKLIAFIAVVSTLISSCTKEDVSMCNPGLQIKFSYLLNNQGANLFGNEVNQITVFAFDASGRYYATFSDGGNHLTNDYVMTIPLPTGKYTLICWGGDMAAYHSVAMIDASNDVSQALTPGETTLEQFRLLVKQKKNKEALGLYYGSAHNVESKSGNHPDTYPIELTKNSNTIRVHITGLGNTLQTTQSRAGETPLFDVTITAKNGRYNHENKIPSDAKTVLYKPHTTTENTDELTYDCNMLRLMIDRQPMLRVVNNQTGDEVCHLNIVEAIMRDPQYVTQQDIDRSDFFPFEFHIHTDLTVSITINGWSIKNVIPEL